MKPARTDHNNSSVLPFFRSISMTNSCTSPIHFSGSDLDQPQSIHNPNNRPSTSCCIDCPMKSKLVTIGASDNNRRTTGWNDNPSVPKMSYYRTISVLHRRFPKTDLLAILRKLTEAFRLLSLDTVFHNSPDLAATCQSLDQVELEVQLFECPRDSSQVLLELNRLDGDTIAYHGYARRILASCFQTGGDEINDKENQLPIDNLGSIDALLKRLEVPEPETEMTQASLEVASNMLLTDRYDARCLGLQSLVFLTDPSKTFPCVAASVAKVVLLGQCTYADGTTHKDPRIQQRILSLALLGRWPDTPPLDEYKIKLDKPHVHLALIVLANSVGLLKDKSNVSMFMEAASRMTAEGTSLLLSLQDRVWNANMEPHAAYLAARILNAICRTHPDTVRCHVQPAAIRAAQKVGQTRHAALEAESIDLLVSLLHHHTVVS